MIKELKEYFPILDHELSEEEMRTYGASVTTFFYEERYSVSGII